MGCVAPSTARQQLFCAAERFRSYHDDLNNRGETVSGWKVNVSKSTVDGILVTPATKAIAGQFTYTPFVGTQWGGNQNRWGGVYLFHTIWHQFGFDGTEIVDTTRPSAKITTPIQDSTFSENLSIIEVEAQDEAGGSGIQRVDFHASYDGGSYYLGTDESFPYSFEWKLPQGLRSQRIMLVPHAFDYAGNRSSLVEVYIVINFVVSQINPEVNEHWVDIENRFYLNQNALGVNGRVMCSMASIAMVRASAGLIGSDTDSMVQEANRVWNTGLRGPGPTQVAKYLRENGMNTSIIWDQDKDAHWKKIKDEIDSNRPVILNGHGNGGNLTKAGHYVVVVGYQESSTSSDRQLIVHDPFGEWKGVKGDYDTNGTSHESPDGTVGKWMFYPFDKLGTIYSITSSRQTDSAVAAHADNVSRPDVISVRDFEDIVIYEGHGQVANDIFLPIIIR